MYSKTAYLAIILAGTAVALPSPPVSPPSVPTIPANGPTYAPVQNYLCEQVEKDETKITCSKQAEWIPTIDYTDHHKAQTRSIYSRGEKPKPLCYKFSDDEKDRVKTKWHPCYYKDGVAGEHDEKPEEQKPKEEKPKEEKPKEEKPKEEKPKEEKPKDDKPKEEKPVDKKPEIPEAPHMDDPKYKYFIDAEPVIKNLSAKVKELTKELEQKKAAIDSCLSGNKPSSPQKPKDEKPEEKPQQEKPQGYGN